ncbi:hypothetical protein [Halorubrum sp. Atlit-26R]|uniref:hypothetical protein n=1 Tax=Halorubrum sp. Atlit-26R TaxID=2282128 RepID=UPI000EF210A3|nr:hypothetical protein [Halorubrum sp. Atlit-26R]RLM62557.1 hypothetical protein DVK07_18600 [Halorubrum sp. Atlit-26R]
MSDAQVRSETIVDADDGLLARFKNARDALPERAVAKPDSERFHRGEAESNGPAPACQRVHSDDWHVVDVDEALLAGLTPCRACWKTVLEYLAADPNSRVAYRAPDATPEPTASPSDVPLPRDRDRRDRPRLSSPTDEVMIDGGSKYHAPAGDETLCGRTGHRVVDRCAVESHYEPCLDCFADVDAEA